MEAVFYFLTNLIFGIIAIMVLIGFLIYLAHYVKSAFSKKDTGVFLPWYGWLQAGDGE